MDAIHQLMILTQKFWQSLKSGCLIHNDTYLTLSLTLTITLTLLILILGTVVNMAPAFLGLPKFFMVKVVFVTLFSPTLLIYIFESVYLLAAKQD